MSLITVTTGDENLKQAIAKVYVFHVPIDGEDRERALSAVAKEGGQCIQRVGSSTFIGAVIGVRHEIGGQWITTQYDIEDGTIIKIFASKKTTWKGLLTTACQFLRVRNDAPLYKIKVKLLNQPQTKLRTADLHGRFDILTLEEARAYGVSVDVRYKKFFIPQMVKMMFEVETLEKATTTKESVTTTVLPAAGDQPAIAIQRRRQRRSLEFRG